MIRKTILVSAALALSIATAHAQPDCAEMVQLKLTVDKYHLELNDKRPICMTVPGMFKIKIKNVPNSSVTVGDGDVTVVQKDDPAEASVLINGINGANGSPVNKVDVEIKLAPDKNVSYGDEFEFLIHVEGVGTLDPRIKVVDNEGLRSLQWAEIEDTLDTLTLDVDDIYRLRPPTE